MGTDGREVHRTYEDADAMVGTARNLSTEQRRRRHCDNHTDRGKWVKETRQWEEKTVGTDEFAEEGIRTCVDRRRCVWCGPAALCLVHGGGGALRGTLAESARGLLTEAN